MPLHIWRASGEAKGWEVVDSLAAWAQPAGTPAPKRMGRPGKSEAAKWETQLRNLLCKAPTGVTYKIDGRTVTVTLGE